MALAGAPSALAQAPSNDDFDAATSIGALPFSSAIDTTQATAAGDDPGPCWADQAVLRTVWYRFTPVSDMPLAVSTVGSNYAPRVSVYTGTRGALELVACDLGYSRPLAVEVAGGTTYHVLIHTHQSWDLGALKLGVRRVLPLANDDFDDATPIETFPFEEAVDTRLATKAVDDPVPSCDALDQSIWYTISESQRTRIELVAQASVYGTSLAVFTGTRGALTEAACSVDQLYVGMAKLGFDAEAGTTYHVVFGGWVGGLGDWVLQAERGLLASTLGLSLSRATLTYGAKVTVTAHLGEFADISNGIVSIYRTPYGGAKTLVKTGVVNAHGDLSAVVAPRLRTTFVAEWAGNARYGAAASRARLVKVHARASVRLSRFFRRDGAYALYRRGVNPRITGATVPAHPGKRLTFLVQARIAGGWRTLGSPRFRIGPNGSVTVYLRNVPPGIPFRVRTRFAADLPHHLGGTSPWAYFRVTS